MSWVWKSLYLESPKRITFVKGILESFGMSSSIPRITGHSKTLIDNMFSNHISKKAICGDLAFTILDHLPQFLIMPSIFSDPSSSKSNV